MTASSYGIHWFRRDLRVVGNPGLRWSWKEHQGRVLGLFAFDSQFLARPDFSHNRFGFFLKTMCALKEELQSIGGDLLVLDIGPEAAFEKLFETIKKAGIALPKTVSFNRDYEPFARSRDKKISELLTKKYGINVHSERDHLLIEPEEIVKEAGETAFYQVYSPFARRWFEKLGTTEIQARISAQRIKTDLSPALFNLTWKELFSGTIALEDHLERYLLENKSRITISLPPAGHAEALKRVRAFKPSALSKYKEQRDFPDCAGTSQLSIYFKNGSITSSQVIAELGLGSQTLKESSSATTFLKEIVWREFYYHILFHCPHVETTAFLEKYRDIKWENNEAWFAAWKNGMTGFPIVDAGMRQLNQTGWMHNRVRMIVASFLTKDLLINWQWGEKYFMEKLLDGDLAPNNGGWQWAASTGCDPQPYFRIFNPLLQSQKFDPNGDYIRCFIPELKDLDAKNIHAPHESGKSLDYPQPIVDHRFQKELALALYRIV